MRAQIRVPALAHQQLFNVKVFTRVFVEQHHGMSQVTHVVGLHQGVGQLKEALMLLVYDLMAGFVSVFPFNFHGLLSNLYLCPVIPNPFSGEIGVP
jgi:hypothetical protein